MRLTMERGKRTILEMRNVSKTYGGSRALRSASLKIREAEIHSLTGSILAASSMLGLIVSLVPNYSFLGFEACLFTGLVLGLTNGALIAFLRLPPWGSASMPPVAMQTRLGSRESKSR
jgi:hypothetical protein